MGLWLLCNTASEEAADFRLTDDSDVELTAGESEGLDNLRGGHRGLRFTYDVADTNRFVYTRITSGMTTPTHVVIADADDALGGKELSLLEWETYPGSMGTVASYTPFGETLIGVDGGDWVGVWDSVLIDPPEALGIALEGGAAADIGKLYICAGQEFNYTSGVDFTRMPVWAPSVLHKGHYYKLYGQARFSATKVTSSELESYLQLPTNDPVFFYDDTGSTGYGNLIPHKLWHCLILRESIAQGFDNLYQVTFDIGILKHGVG